MTRLPTPGQDNGTWGDILNEFLAAEHNADGTLKVRSDGTFYAKPAGGIPKSDLAAAVQTTLDNAAAVNSDATSSSKGVIQLAGDLSGSATVPTIASGAVTGSKIASSTITTTNLSSGIQTSLTKADGSVQVSTATTKGDMLAASGASTVSRLGVGADGQILTADSTQPLGVKWASGSGSTDANAVHKGDLLFNVVDYGATTASTDNKTAIDAAITAAATSGGIVFFPAGTWKTTGQHNIPLNVSVQGAGKGITFISHRGVGTYCLFIGSASGGPNPPSYMGKIGNFSLSGQSSGDGTGPWGQQVGIFVQNCLFFNLQDINMKSIYKAFYIDGGDEVALGAGTFAGNGYVANCTTSNVYIAFHIYRWVTDTTFSFIYGSGNSPITTGSIGLWVQDKMSTSTFLNPSFEGYDTGFKIGTSRQGITFLGPRIESCNTPVSWENDTYGHIILGGITDVPTTWAAGAKIGQNTQIAREGWFPVVTSLPTPSAAYRKMIYWSLGGAGVKDAIYVCIKDATDSYIWQDITTAPTGGGGSSPLLATKSYNPASITPISTTVSSNSFQVIDGTNLAVTFTAPTSGKVLVRLNGVPSRTGTGDVYWGLFDSSNTLVSGSGALVTTSTGTYINRTITTVVSGLTPSQSYTWKWVQRTTVNSGTDQATLRVGGDPTANGYAPAVMEIWSA